MFFCFFKSDFVCLFLDFYSWHHVMLLDLNAVILA